VQVDLPVPLAIRRRLARWIRIGRRPEMLPSEARYVVLANIIALLGALFSLGFAPFLVITGSWIYPALQVAYTLGYLPVLWLNHRGHRLAATTWLLLGGHLLVVSQVLVEGVGFDVQLFFMLHAVLPFLLFPPRHGLLMITLSIVAGIDLVIVVVFGERLPQLGPAIAPEDLSVLRPILAGGMFASLAMCAYYARRATLIAEEALDRAHQRSEALLLNILPAPIAHRLKQQTDTIADGFTDVTVLFADIVGFTTLSSRMPPSRIVGMLDELFCKFDDLVSDLGLEKIKTIGDCYMVAGGLPEPRSDHAEAVAEMALAILRVTREYSAQANEQITVRIGICTGPVVAGVIGKRKFIYDLWGDTVNTASRMESHGVPGTVHVAESAQRLLAGKYHMTARGTIEVKGKGAMETWFLHGRLEDG
jgi:class 3 adenylate cyclase